MYQNISLFFVFILAAINLTAQNQEVGYDYLRAKGLIYFHRSDYKNANRYFLQAQKSNDVPKHYDIDLLLKRSSQCAKLAGDAKEFYEIGYYSDALDNYREILILNPSDSVALSAIDSLNNFVLDDYIYSFKNDGVVKVIKGERTEEHAEQGYYIVPHTFKSVRLAQTESERLLEDARLSEIFYNPKRQWYYISVYQEENLQNAILKREELIEKGYIETTIHFY